MIEKPPIGGKDLIPLTSVQLAGFRLHPGPVSKNSNNSNKKNLLIKKKFDKN